MAELSAGYIITQSFRTYFKNLGLMAKYALSLAALLIIDFAASVVFLGSEFLNTADERVTPQLSALILTSGIIFITSLGSLMLTIALIREVCRAYTGQPRQTMTDELHTARSLLWPSIYTILPLILPLLLTLLPIILLVIGVTSHFNVPQVFVPLLEHSFWASLAFTPLFFPLFFWLYIRYCLLFPALAIDGIRGWAAYKTSAALLHGRWWKMFFWSIAYSVVAHFISKSVSEILLIPVGFFAGINLQGSWFLANILSILVSTFAFPLTIIPLVIIYENLKNLPPASN